MAFFRKLHTGGGTHEFVRHTHENACAVARVLLGAHGTTMVQIDQHLDGVIDDLAFRTLVEGGDHTHAASVMLGSGIVHTLGIMDRRSNGAWKVTETTFNVFGQEKSCGSLMRGLEYRAIMSATLHVSI